MAVESRDAGYRPQRPPGSGKRSASTASEPPVKRRGSRIGLSPSTHREPIFPQPNCTALRQVPGRASSWKPRTQRTPSLDGQSVGPDAIASPAVIRSAGSRTRRTSDPRTHDLVASRIVAEQKPMLMKGTERRLSPTDELGLFLLPLWVIPPCSRWCGLSATAVSAGTPTRAEPGSTVS